MHGSEVVRPAFVQALWSTYDSFVPGYNIY